MTVPLTTDLSLSDTDLEVVAGAMAGVGAAVCGDLRAELLAGGRSNLTYRITDGTTAWVLRTPPRVGRTPSAHDVAREFRVTAALLGTGVGVARPVVLCGDDTAMGLPFSVVEFVDGETLRTRTDLDALAAATVGALADELVGTLAALHAVDHVAVGLERFGRPNAYFERQARRWAGQWDHVGAPELSALAGEVVRRLQAARPTQPATSIVHGDFRVDNTLVRLDDGPQIAAVVDWELSTIGDPVADVALMCAYRAPVFDLIVGSEAAWTSPRLPGVGDLAARYEAASGRRLDHWDLHLGLAYFKIGVIAAGIAYRASVGGATGPGFDTAGQTVAPYLELARGALAGGVA
ncbi:phosphotransferase family protein [Nocardioides hwasunensis]|uniref:Phosphotransferase family protein n=1 Tax=Nocardioides hwasunensis TaxID=397258 RepID=A0ABR8MJ13_9ACTN|nr:phosphotransferase family protein [Nocardioides hwasunensis]MBD3915051.1 phosphotransferase family protein [Nocardioides hwasunensis]